MYILDIDIGLALKVAYRSFCYSLCCDIYKLIINLYKLFEMLCNAVLIDNSVLSNIYHRIGLVLGVIMLFRVIFSFIKYLINPDELQDKEKGAFNLVKKIIVVIVMLGSVSYIFDFAFKIQKELLSTQKEGGNVVSRLLLPYSVDTDNFGAVFSENILFSFFYLNDNAAGTTEYTDCGLYMDKLRENIENPSIEDFSVGFNCIGMTYSVGSNQGNTDEDFVAKYNGILSVVVGLFVCWFLLVYCFSVGVRIVQLTFLQIIAPMPIISYLSPQKDGMFQKWGKMCITTYLDVFIRVAIINFVVLLIGLVMDSFESFNSVFWASTGATLKSRGFLLVIIVLALLQFAKKAPELIKELLPKSWAASGDFGFGLKNRDMLGRTLAAAGGVAAGGAVGLISGIGNGIRNRSIGSGISGALGGLLGGARRGIGGGIHNKGASFSDIAKGINDVRSKQADVSARRAEAIAGGSTFFGRTAASIQKSIGVSTAGDVDQRDLSYYDEYLKQQDIVEGYAENDSDIKKLKRRYEAIQNAGRMIVGKNPDGTDKYEDDDVFMTRLENARDAYKDAVKLRINNAINGVGPDDDVARSIRAGVQHINSLHTAHSKLFGNYKTINSYDDMDNNTKRARGDSAELTSTVRYSRNQANNKFSSKK